MSDIFGKMIEAQEAAGQREMVRGGHLPKFNERREPIDRAAFEALGFSGWSREDDLFVDVNFPVGWSYVPRPDHNMWSEIKDAGGRVRGRAFYKAAFYDRRAHVRLLADDECESCGKTDGTHWPECDLPPAPSLSSSPNDRDTGDNE